jgi:hypothetical protein
VAECLDDLLDDRPSTGDIGAFSSSYFDPTETTPLSSRATISAWAETGYGFACADWNGEDDYELIGAMQGMGPLRIDPRDGTAFYPTVLDRVNLLTERLPTLVVFTNEQVDGMFEQLQENRDPDAGHVLLEVACPMSDTGRGRWLGTSVSASAGTLTYSSGAGFSEELEATTEDGLVLVANIPAAEGFIDSVTITSDETSLSFSVVVSSGAVSFQTYCPGDDI